MEVIDSSAALADLERRHDNLLEELDSLNETLEKALREASGKPPHAGETTSPDVSTQTTSAGPDGRSC